MQARNVVVGHTYLVLVSGKLVPVRLLDPAPRGGWVGRNLATDRVIHIRTAGWLRRSLTPAPAGLND